MLVTPWLLCAALQLMAQLLLFAFMPAVEGLLKLLALTPGTGTPPQLRPVKQLLLLGD